MSQPLTGGKIDWSREVLASVVVFFVAFPLCMGIAIASGVPPALGLITGIVGGILVGSLGGSPLQVSGPAAGLAVLVWQFVGEFGLPMLGVAVLLSGVIQAVAGGFKIGRWFRAVSPALIRGMLAGIGVLIFASQFHVMVDDAPRSSALENLISIPAAVYKGIVPSGGNVHHFAALIGVLTIATILLWDRFRPQVLKAVPGPLVGVLLATLAANVFGLGIQRTEVPANLADNLNVPALSDFARVLEPRIAADVLAFALIGSAETLLCATAVDRVAGTRTNYDRELWAQGLGNIVCGAVGALPLTGVIVRSSANINAGAKTRWSTVLHGVWILGLVGLAPGVLEMIPTASLGAVLVYTGLRLALSGQLRQLARVGRGELLVFAVTLFTIVAFDLLTGVMAGFAVALAKLLYTFSHLEILVREDEESDRVDIGLVGAATFLRLPALAAALEAQPANKKVRLHVGALAYIDHACMELIKDFQAKHEREGGQVAIEWDVLRSRTGAVAKFSTNPPPPDEGEEPSAKSA